VNVGLKRGFDTFHLVKRTFHFFAAIALAYAVWQHGSPGSAERTIAMVAILLLIGGGIWLTIRRLDRTVNKADRSSEDKDRFTRG